MKVFSCCLFVLVTINVATAATVRGRLDHVWPNGQRVPAVGFAVTVFRPDTGRTNPYYTGQDGMYYLNVPAGSYSLEIWVSTAPGSAPAVYVIQVNEPVTDIAPIVV
jgi:hypothetical protein